MIQGHCRAGVGKASAQIKIALVGQESTGHDRWRIVSLVFNHHTRRRTHHMARIDSQNIPASSGDFRHLGGDVDFWEKDQRSVIPGIQVNIQFVEHSGIALSQFGFTVAPACASGNMEGEGISL